MRSASNAKRVVAALPRDKKPVAELQEIRSVEESLFASQLPRNCHFPICGHPAHNRDLNRRWWCEEHKDRGKF